MKFYSFKVWDRVELRDRSRAGTVVRTITTRLGAQAVEVQWDAYDGIERRKGDTRPKTIRLSYDLVPALELVAARVLA
jgi:hypothetical protein